MGRPVAGVHEWKRRGPTRCWVSLGVQTEGQSLRKADCRAGLGMWVGAERALGSPASEGLEARQVDARCSSILYPH